MTSGQGSLRSRVRRESPAVAGLVYAVLAAASVLIIDSYPRGFTDAEWAEWIADASNRGELYWAASLGSISAVAFLWFLAVVRRRFGDREDQFFATVFLGSGFIYVGLWLTVLALAAAPAVHFDLTGNTLSADAHEVMGAVIGSIVLFAGPRIQAVFVASTSTKFVRTQVLPKWLGVLGMLLAVAMFVMPFVWTPTGLALPLFVVVVSLTILFSPDDQAGDVTVSA